MQRVKLIVDLDLKLLAKWSPRYGDKPTLTGDADNPIVVENKGSELATELLGLLRSRKRNAPQTIEAKASPPVTALPKPTGKA